MTETNPPVDAGGTETASESQPANKDVAYWKNEMHNAVTARQAAKEKLKASEARAADLESQLAAVQRPADASEDITKQLATLTEERDALSVKLETQTKEHRESSVIDRLMKGLPDENRKAITSLYRTHAAPLDDGTAEIADVVKEAGELLAALAAPLFNTKPGPAKGRLPNDGTAPQQTLEAKREEIRKARKAMGATGVSLG